MKRLFWVIIVTVIFFLTSPVSYAQNSATNSSDLKNQEIINYQLPYPGLLPDNPLYIFKMIRDRVIGFLISDSTKKVDFDILQADKRLAAGFYLFPKGEAKYSLAISTISKGENYFDDAIAKLKLAKKQGIPVGDNLDKLKLSLRKHESVLKDLESKTSGSYKSQLALQERKIKELQKQAVQIKAK